MDVSTQARIEAGGAARAGAPAGDAADGAGMLDRLLALVDVDGRLEVRCELGAGWDLAQDAAEGHHMPFHVLLDGEALVDADGLSAAPMRAGDVLMLPGGGAHRLRDRDPASLTRPGEGALLCGRFVVPAASARLVRALVPPALVVRGEGPDSRLTRLLALMREETDAPGEGAAALLRHLSGALFAVALRAAMAAATEERSVRHQASLDAGATPGAPSSALETSAAGVLALSAHPRLAALAVALLREPAADWTLDGMAERAHLSRSSLIRAFQAAAGVSPAEFLTQIRMTEAGRRLRAGRDSVAAIGEAVGYASEAAFQRAFKRETGLTPAAWRAAGEIVTPVALPERKRLAG